MTDTTTTEVDAPAAGTAEQAEPPVGAPDGQETAGAAGDEQLGDAGRKALQAEREAAKTAREEADRLREENETAQTELAELKKAELRRSVATDKRLTAEQAELLVGDDAAAMAAHADQLLAAFEPKPDPLRRPVERLIPGAVPEIDTTSASDVADQVLGG